MARLGLLAVALVLAVATAIALLVVFRPSVSAPSAVDPDVTVQCMRLPAGAECGAAGDRLLGAGPPSNTFDMDDVVVAVEWPALGDENRCRAAWYIERYPDDPVWEDEVSCPAAGG